MTESEIQQDIVKMLSLSPQVAWCMVITSGTVRGANRRMQVGMYVTSDMKRLTGVSDILGQMVDGRMLAIEVKKPGKKPTEAQMRFIETVNNANGLAGWADSISAAQHIIKGVQ